jgi:hypothetical protein
MKVNSTQCTYVRDLNSALYEWWWDSATKKWMKKVQVGLNNLGCPRELTNRSTNKMLFGKTSGPITLAARSWLPERWDSGFESHTRHWCILYVRDFLRIAALCRWRHCGGLTCVQGIPPNVWKNHNGRNGSELEQAWSVKSCENKKKTWKKETTRET